MENAGAGYKNIDEYILLFPPKVQEMLKELRAAIRAEAPDAEEKISYRMPTFFRKGNLIHFAAFKRHIGIYPTPNGIEGFKEELKAYKGGKGSVQFPIDEPLPLDLIRRIVRYRVEKSEKNSIQEKAAK